MNTSEIQDAIRDEIVARNCFFVEINLTKDNDIEIVIESKDSSVTLEDCVAISRAFEEKFDRETEDYSLTVTSAGLDQPFKVAEQFRKAVGTKVEVAFRGGKKLIAELSEADDDGITLKYSAKEAVEGKKKKEVVEHNDRFSMDSINSVRPFVEFE